MGVSTSPSQLAAKFERMVGEIERANVEAVKAGAETVKSRTLAAAAAEIGGDLTFGGKNPVRVRYDFAAGGRQAIIAPRGSGMSWLERGVKPHAIAPKGAGGSRAARTAFVSQAFGSGPISFGRGRRAGVLAFADGNVRPYARKAGKLTARHSWSKGVQAAIPAVAAQWHHVQGGALVRVFG